MSWCYIRTHSAKVESLRVYIIIIIELFLLLDVGVTLQDFVDSLLNDTHVGHHVRLSNTLGSKELLVSFWVALDDVEYIFDTRPYRIHFGLRLPVLKTKLLGLHLGLGQLLLQFFEVSLFLVVVVRTSATASLHFLLHISDLLLEVLDFVAELVHELE